MFVEWPFHGEIGRESNNEHGTKRQNLQLVRCAQIVNSASHDAPLPLRPSELFHANPNCI